MVHLTTLTLPYLITLLIVLFGIYPMFYRFLTLLRRRKNSPALKVGITALTGVTQAAEKDQLVSDHAHEFIRDVMTELGSRMGREIAIAPIADSSSGVDALERNELDIVVMDGISAMQRSTEIDVVSCQTHMLSSFALVFWDKVPHHVSSLQDFTYYPNNITVVLEKSSERRFLKQFSGIRTSPVESVTDFIIQLKLGLARAGLMRIEHVHSLRREYANLKYVPVCIHQHDALQGERIGVAYKNKALLGHIEKLS